jgi:hypothetical protein
MGVEELLPIAHQVARAMEAAHERNVLHRDLKPENILVRREAKEWKVKVIDFGLALRRQGIDTSGSRSAAEETCWTRSVAGTLSYAPPEQLGRLPGVKPGAYSDVYSFGKTCCYALFRTTEPRRRQWAAIPEELAELLERCIEQELADRHASFTTVLQGLEALGTLMRKHTTDEGWLTRVLQAVDVFGVSRKATGGGPHGVHQEASQPREPSGQGAAKPAPEVRQMEVTVPGVWYARPVDRPEAGWTRATETPGTVTLAAGEAYRLQVAVIATDEDLSDLAQLRGLSSLQELDLGGCKEVTEEGLAHLRQLTSLQTLRLAACDQVNDECLANVRGLSHLRELDLSDCEYIEEECLAHLRRLTNLQRLDLRGCKAITDDALAYLRRLRSLQYLDLSFCEQITDDGLSYLRRLSALQHLLLCGCEQITDDGLAYLRRMPTLLNLNLEGCEQITDDGLGYLRSLTALQHLNLRGCLEITDASVAQFQKALPNCRIER